MSALPFAQAQTCVLQQARLLETERINLADALGRVLAEDVYANRNHPPCDVSAMDGYAVRAADLAAADGKEIVLLRLVGDIRAGQQPDCTVGSGEAARIMTGAAVPAGADTVVRVEDTSTTAGCVCIQLPPQAGANIRSLGENLRLGEKLLAAGSPIRPAETGILAMVKQAEVNVYRRPRVAILATGDELEALEEPLDERRIPDANSHTLNAQMRTLGIVPEMLGIARDDTDELRHKLSLGLNYDILLVSGGISVGAYDFVRPTLEALGVELHFWRVAMRPGYPLVFGTTASTLVFGLPGNPVSSMVCCEQFALPAARKMLGHNNCFQRTVSARLTAEARTGKGFVHFLRVRLARDKEGYLAEPVGPGSSGVLMSMVAADGLAIIPAECERLAAGSRVEVQLLYGAQFQNDMESTA